MKIFTIDSTVICQMEDDQTYTLDGELKFTVGSTTTMFPFNGGEGVVHSDVDPLDIPADVEGNYTFDGTTFTAV